MANDVIERSSEEVGTGRSSEPIGVRFASALALKDAVALKAMLRSDVDFKALTPGRFWEAQDADVVVDDIMLGIWFEPERRITATLALDADVAVGADVAVDADAGGGGAGGVERVGYRFRVARPDGGFILEQQAYYRADGDQISWLRIMCTGFLPIVA